MMTLKCSEKRQQNQRGFTLVEVAIVVIISGLLIAGAAKTYENYLKQYRIGVTEDNIRVTNALISAFRVGAAAYPCPADPTLGPGDPGFGVANCGAAGVVSTAGERDTDVDADLDAGNETIHIGAIPITTLKAALPSAVVPNMAILDGWGGKLKYAVSTNLTDRDDYAFNRGVIAAEDEFGEPTAGINNDAHYVIVSHGADQLGAYSLEGTQRAACGGNALTPGGPPPPVPPAGTVLGDSENCDDNDGIFRQVPVEIAGNQADTFDDYTYFQRVASSDLWGAIAGTGDIRNLNTGNVGVNANMPAHRFTVEAIDNADVGVLRVDNNVRATWVCATNDPDRCYRVSSFDTPDTAAVGDISCPPGEVMVGIGRSTTTDNTDPDFGRLSHVCRSVDFAFNPPVDLPNLSCGADWYLHGINTGGEICCVQANVNAGPDDPPNRVQCISN